MSNITDLGKVSIVLKGEYNANTNYERLDVVTYQGSSYACKQDCKGIAVINTTYWQLLAQHGEVTQEQYEDFKRSVLEDAKAEMDEYTEGKETELNTYTNTKKIELDNYENDKETELDTYTNTKISEYNTNATNKTNTFNDNATAKTTAFDENATNKTNDFNTNASTKTTDFNTNATDKTNAFNQNVSDKIDDFNANATEKTGEYNTNAENKIAEFNAEKEELQNEIDEINTLIDTELDTGEVEGTEIGVEDSAEYPGKMMIKANELEQESTKGNQLLGLTDGTYSDNGVTANVQNGVVVLSGTASANSFIRIPLVDNLLLKSGVQNILGANNAVVVGDATNYVAIRLHSGTDDTSTDVKLNYINSTTLINKSADITYIALTIRTAMGISFNNTIIKPMLNSGNVALEFEKYTGGIASPNPEYPEKVKVVRGDNEVSQIGKNWFDSLEHKYIARRAYDGAGNLMYWDGYYGIETYISIQSNTTYTFSNSEGKPMYYGLVFYDINKKIISSIINETRTFTTPINCKYIRFAIQNANIPIWTQIEKGTTATEYEPYKQTKYPINLGVENLLQNLYPNSSGTNNGIDYIKNIDGSMVLNGIATSNTFFVLNTLDLLADTYTLSGCPAGGSENGYRLDTLTTSIQTKEYGEGATFKLNEPTSLQFRIRIEQGTIVNNLIFKPQLEKGTKANSYSPYGQTPIELYKIGDYQDILFKNVPTDENYNASLEEGKWYKLGKVGKRVLDGSENWTLRNPGQEMRFSIDIPSSDGNYVLDALCDKYINVKTWEEHTATNYSFIVRNGNWGINMCRISFTNKDYSKVSDWKAELASNNLIVYYQLEEAYWNYTEITNETLIQQLEALYKLKMYYGVNNFSIEATEVKPIMDLTYKISNKLKLDNKQDKTEETLIIGWTNITPNTYVELNMDNYVQYSKFTILVYVRKGQDRQAVKFELTASELNKLLGKATTNELIVTRSCKVPDTNLVGLLKQWVQRPTTPTADGIGTIKLKYQMYNNDGSALTGLDNFEYCMYAE